MPPSRSCPTRERCEVLGECCGLCKPRQVAVTPQPIPLHLRHLSDDERRHGLVRLTEGLTRMLRRPQREQSQPFLALTQEPAMSDPILPPAAPVVLSSVPEPTLPTREPPKREAPPKAHTGPSMPLQILPVRTGGYVVLAGEAPNRETLAVALDPNGLADAVKRWARGDLT